MFQLVKSASRQRLAGVAGWAPQTCTHPRWGLLPATEAQAVLRKVAFSNRRKHPGLWTDKFS